MEKVYYGKVPNCLVLEKILIILNCIVRIIKLQASEMSVPKHHNLCKRIEWIFFLKWGCL